MLFRVIQLLLSAQGATWLHNRLLRSPTFHKMVGHIHQRVQYHRHGIPMEESRTSLPGHGDRFQRFFSHFKDEFKNQLKGKPTEKF
ncbi:hypothetical protein N7468_004589 [Penicillium chermesinum]|uniref:Uncharacterized protein n=1 Tax=Penicillium chermesinum TaxID=63820 RepID=A0A9W9P921_9EURO|nr:uncharacterized protein N7468_004589 [Penicillium chermesinum]KAJ5239970.1 hypothetical protein N7468_004589 [Penicillium chermesinum]KAJ6166845.1 hypothetical protein N7470_002292 [Penicillium chermesinum]